MDCGDIDVVVNGHLLLLLITPFVHLLCSLRHQGVRGKVEFVMS